MRSPLLSALAATLVTSLPAVAQDRVSVLLGSRHLGSEPGSFNEDNPGLFLTWDNWTVGGYLNSYEDVSLAVTHAWAIGEHVDLFAGVATYERPMPIAGVQVHWRGLFVQIIPSDGRDVDAIITFGLTAEFD